MSSQSSDAIREALAKVAYPGFSRDIVSFGIVRDVAVEDGRARVRLAIKSNDEAVKSELRRRVIDTVSALPGISGVEVSVGEPAPSRLPSAGQAPAAAAPSRDLTPNTRHVIGVASGKGGVGKSTVAVNMAVAMAASGKRVGFLDADVHGPSAPLLFGLQDQKPHEADEQGRPKPLEAYGVRVMSMGFFVERENAVIWRGPIVGNFIRQLLGDVSWGELDALIIDFPPGTGDAQLTISQTIRMSGSIIVTTPNDLAIIDALKGIAMFRKVEVPVLGVVENMAYFRCPSCSHESEIFGPSKVAAALSDQSCPVIGRIPIDPDVVADSDHGRPVVVAHPESTPSQAYAQIAETAWEGAEKNAAPTGGLGSFLDRFDG